MKWYSDTLALNSAALGKIRAIVPEQGNTEQTEEGTELSEQANQNKKKGMILPFEPYSLTFDDIKYSVDMPKVITLHSGVQMCLI